MKLAAATPNPERLVVMHFFDPAPVLPLVEVIPCELTSDETLYRVKDFGQIQLGKTIITAKDPSGPVAAEGGGRRSRPQDWSRILHLSVGDPESHFPLSSELLYLAARPLNSEVKASGAMKGS